MPDVDSTAVSGVEVGGYRRGAAATDRWDQYVIPVRDRISSFKGRACTFVTPGRGAVQRLAAIHNATSSPVLVNVNRVRVDLLTTLTKAIGTQPPTIRVHRFTTLPTGGTALTKAPQDSAMTSNASVTLWGDSSADNAGAGTLSATALTITAGAAMAQAFAPRVAAFAVPATGSNPFYEPLDTIEFFQGEPDITLRALEGLVVVLDNAATAALGNPSTDKWLAQIDWEEYTRP